MRAFRAIGVVVAGCTSPPATPVTCGPGTMLDGTECVAMVLTCGAGSHDDGGTCVADMPAFTIRAPHDILADGATPHTVVVFGPDEQVVLNTDRPNTGVFTPATVTLVDHVATASFVGCSNPTPGCTGPVALTVASASAPTTAVASYDAVLLPPPFIGSIAECQTGGDVLYIESSSNFMYPGKLTVENATFSRSGGNQRAQVDIVPDDPRQGSGWTFEVSSVQLGAPLAAGTYYDAYQVPGVGHAGLKVTGQTPYADCLFAYQGEFQVHDFQFTTQVEHMTVSFREWCGSPTNKLVTGCMHIE